jgi:hypothetical protein
VTRTPRLRRSRQPAPQKIAAVPFSMGQEG